MNNDLTEGKVLKVLLKFLIPFFIANLLQALYGGVDLFVVVDLTLHQNLGCKYW